jgi:hypothetical protein
MSTKKKVLIAIFSVLIALTTVVSMFFINLYVNFQLGNNGGIKNFAQILVFTFGIYFTFAFISHSIKQNIYFVIGILMVLITMLSFVQTIFVKINFFEQFIPQSVTTIDSVVMIFCGLFFLTHSLVSLPKIEIGKLSYQTN